MREELFVDFICCRLKGVVGAGWVSGPKADVQIIREENRLNEGRKGGGRR